MLVLGISGAPQTMRNAGIKGQEADLDILQATDPGR